MGHPPSRAHTGSEHRAQQWGLSPPDELIGGIHTPGPVRDEFADTGKDGFMPSVLGELRQKVVEADLCDCAEISVRQAHRSQRPRCK